MNKVVLIGRLTNEPEVKYTQSQQPMAVAKYTLAVDRKGKKDEADFIRCTAFGKGGEFAEKYLHKGMKIAVSGRIQTGSYDDKDGKKVYTTDVIVEESEFVEKKSEGGNAAPTELPPTNDFVSVPAGIDEDLPFGLPQR